MFRAIIKYDTHQDLCPTVTSSPAIECSERHLAQRMPGIGQEKRRNSLKPGAPVNKSLRMVRLQTL